MADEQRDVSDLGSSIAGADEGRRTPPPPLPRGWAGLVERDRRARASSHPNAAGGFATIFYPWRLHILVVSIVLIPILLLISLLS